MTEQKELLNEYYTETFTFKHIYEGVVKYESKARTRTKTVIVELAVDYMSDLDLHEPLSSLDSECEIIKITVI